MEKICSMAQKVESGSLKSTPKIFENAKKLRKELTDAEKKIWDKLRNRNFRNLKFRRQHPIDKYIADFYCAEYNLIIEVDGGIHLSQEQKDYDQLRTKALESLGMRVIRFKNEDVLLDINQTLKRIEKFIFNSAVRPQPSPPSGVGGVRKKKSLVVTKDSQRRIH